MKPLRIIVCPFCASQEFTVTDELEIKGLGDMGDKVNTLICSNPECSSRQHKGHSVMILLVPNIGG